MLHRIVLCASAGFAAVALLSGAAATAMTPSGAIISALSDAARPQADKDRDEQRKPADLMSFAAIKPGDKVADVFPGGGYVTRIFSRLVGTSGTVYAITPAGGPSDKLLPANPAYPNIVASIAPLDHLGVPAPLDVIWTSDNYHDFKNVKLPGGGDGAAALNRGAFEALRPGGVYIVVDHTAAANAPDDVTKTLHRIKQQTVMSDVTAAGFKFESQSTALANAADSHETKVFDPAIRGRTDQFVLKFRKPGLPKP